MDRQELAALAEAEILEEIEVVADDPDPKPAAAYPPWVKPISCYQRRETTTVEGLRYG
jgi:hypothetical protein